jgi:hypothetical protein
MGGGRNKNRRAGIDKGCGGQKALGSTSAGCRDPKVKDQCAEEMMAISVGSEGLEPGRRDGLRLKPLGLGKPNGPRGLFPRSTLFNGQADHVCLWLGGGLCKRSGVWPSPHVDAASKKGRPCRVEFASFEQDSLTCWTLPGAESTRRPGGLSSTGPARGTRGCKAFQVAAEGIPSHSPENTTWLQLPGCGGGPLCGF